MGYNDLGRDTLEAVYSEFVSMDKQSCKITDYPGTHALSIALGKETYVRVMNF